MRKLATSPQCAGLFISDAYSDWQPTQVWLTEVTRMVATRLYAQTSDQGGADSDSATVAVHKGAITGQVSKVFGALFDESAAHMSISWNIDVLARIQDLADIGYGYYLPRESRVVRLGHGWGRIAGGLPLDLSEHPEGGIKSVHSGTIGRLVKLAEDFSPHDQGTEYSELFEWAKRSSDQIFSDLHEQLPERSASRPSEDAIVYYNPHQQRARTRGDRWQNRLSSSAFVVARTGSLPAHYYVYLPEAGRGSASWFEVTHEQARRWVLLAERIARAMNLVPADGSARGIRFTLPDMLPAAWTAAFFASSSIIVPNDKGWTLQVEPEAMALLEILLRGANIQLI